MSIDLCNLEEVEVRGFELDGDGTDPAIDRMRIEHLLAVRHLSPTATSLLDAGSGGGFDCFVAAHQVGRQGHVVGVDMLAEMLEKSRRTAESMGLKNIAFREGLLEEMPVQDGWADVVISNGVINLCADKKRVFAELWRVLRPGGILQFADIANGKPVPESAICNIDLWTA